MLHCGRRATMEQACYRLPFPTFSHLQHFCPLFARTRTPTSVRLNGPAANLGVGSGVPAFPHHHPTTLQNHCSLPAPALHLLPRACLSAYRLRSVPAPTHLLLHTCKTTSISGGPEGRHRGRRRHYTAAVGYSDNARACALALHQHKIASRHGEKHGSGSNKISAAIT